MKHHITTACNWCRIKKIRCDGFKPCFQCEKRNIFCEYEKYRKKRGPHPKNVSTESKKFINNIKKTNLDYILN